MDNVNYKKRYIYFGIFILIILIIYILIRLSVPYFSKDDLIKTYSNPKDAVQNYPWANMNKSYPIYYDRFDDDGECYKQSVSIDTITLAKESQLIPLNYRSDYLDNSNKKEYVVEATIFCNPTRSNILNLSDTGVRDIIEVTKQNNNKWIVTNSFSFPSAF